MARAACGLNSLATFRGEPFERPEPKAVWWSAWTLVVSPFLNSGHLMSFGGQKLKSKRTPRHQEKRQWTAHSEGSMMRCKKPTVGHWRCASGLAAQLIPIFR